MHIIVHHQNTQMHASQISNIDFSVFYVFILYILSYKTICSRLYHQFQFSMTAKSKHKIPLRVEDTITRSSIAQYIRIEHTRIAFFPTVITLCKEFSLLLCFFNLEYQISEGFNFSKRGKVSLPTDQRGTHLRCCRAASRVIPANTAFVN